MWIGCQKTMDKVNYTFRMPLKAWLMWQTFVVSLMFVCLCMWFMRPPPSISIFAFTKGWLKAYNGITFKVSTNRPTNTLRSHIKFIHSYTAFRLLTTFHIASSYLMPFKLTYININLRVWTASRYAMNYTHQTLHNYA